MALTQLPEAGERRVVLADGPAADPPRQALPGEGFTQAPDVRGVLTLVETPIGAKQFTCSIHGVIPVALVWVRSTRLRCARCELQG